MKPRSVSLTMIAETCGVSRMTVSRALRGHTNVNPDLAVRIRDTADSLGYQRDPWLGSMMAATRLTHKVEYRETVAFIWTSREKFSWQEYFGVMEQAETFRFKVDTFEPKMEGLSGRRMAEVLESRGISGVIIAPNSDRNHPHYWLPWDKFSCVLIGKSLRNRGLLRVQHDHFQAGQEAAQHARHQGYRRPGLVVDTSFHERSWRNYAAAMSVFSQGPLNLDEAVWDQWHWKTRSAASFQAWYQKRRPDVLLVQNQDVADWLEGTIKLSIPGEVGVVVVSLNGPSTRWTGVVQKSEQVGREAMKALAIKILMQERGKMENPPTINVPGVWNPGTTLPGR